MSRTRLSDVVRRWVYRIRRPARPARRNYGQLGLTEFEARIAPAILPASQVFETRFITNYGPALPPPNAPSNAYQSFGAVAAIDPNNPLKMVQVSVRVLQNNNEEPTFPQEFVF